jgi:hypothetical protein
MAIRSTTSQYQPAPPNYRLATTGPFRNVGRYRAVTAANPGPTAANMSTAPVQGNGAQYRYSPRISG